MQKLKNTVTGVEYIITGSIGVPREINENTFEVWTHFSVDLGEGQIDTIEIHPESTEWEVVDVPNTELAVEPEPEPVEPVPMPIESQEDIDRKLWLSQWQIYKKAKNAMQELTDAGFTPTAEEATRFETLKTWVGTNRKPEYSQYI